MCLAVPLKLISIDSERGEGTVEMGGSPKTIGLDLAPAARPGDFVLVHAGMAIEVMEAEEAEATLAVFRQYALVPGLLAPDPDQS
jgi:hydrogenase expression/formation protein HypC